MLNLKGRSTKEKLEGIIINPWLEFETWDMKKLSKDLQGFVYSQILKPDREGSELLNKSLS